MEVFAGGGDGARELVPGNATVQRQPQLAESAKGDDVHARTRPTALKPRHARCAQWTIEPLGRLQTKTTPLIERVTLMVAATPAAVTE